MEAAKDIYKTLIKQLEMNYGISDGDIIYNVHNQSWTYRCKNPTVIKVSTRFILKKLKIPVLVWPLSAIQPPFDIPLVFGLH